MLDLKYVLQNLEAVRARLATRPGQFLQLDQIVGLDYERRSAITEVEQLKAERNDSSKRIGALIKGGQDVEPLKASVRQLGERISELDARASAIESELQELLIGIPNLPHQSVPVGSDERANRVERSWGQAPRFDFAPKDHVELGEQSGILDFERASKITGARFALLTGMGARLERALINFMLDLHTTHHGYLETLPPFIVNRQSLFGTGQLPKFEQDLFRLADPADWFLAPTAEVPVTNIHRDEILNEAELPKLYAAYTPCFRAEAGSHGRDVRGMIRQHQFNKVEIVQLTTPETSYQAHEQLTSHAEAVLQRLGLHYRVVCLSSGDIGFSSAKTYDLEVWLPSQNTYREISSCSNFEDFQARRLNLRYRPHDGSKPRYCHTLNGSGLAVGRTLIAILENYQQADGSIAVPSALEPYLQLSRQLK
jgi:seryl-tRNA synthetase